LSGRTTELEMRAGILGRYSYAHVARITGPVLTLSM